MRRLRNRHIRGLAALLVITIALPVLAKERIFTMPRMFHAKTYPAHDAHPDEKLTIAADPYDMPDKQKTVFVTDYRSRDLLPIHVVLTNDDTKQAVNLTDMRVTLITKGRTKIYPADPDDIWRRVGRQTRRGDEQPKVQLPIPLPRKGPNKAVSDETKAEVEGAMFLARAVEPGGSQGGFFFFDVEGLQNPLAGARLTITGLKKGGQELFYFEIPMEKYLGYDPLKQQQPSPSN